MDRHRPFQDWIGGLGVHHVENAVDGLITINAENSGTENFLGVGIGHRLHETLGLTLFHCAANAGHRPGRDEDLAAALARLGFSHADAAEWRIDVERIGRHTLADLSIAAIKEIRRDDLEIIVGRVGKRAAPIAVAERKASPLSDTVNLATATAGSDIYSHIRESLWTSVPALGIAVVAFSMLGKPGDFDATAFLRAIDSKMHVSLWAFIPLVLVFALSVARVAPFARCRRPWSRDDRRPR
jgi:hypothetical protein